MARKIEFAILLLALTFTACQPAEEPTTMATDLLEIIGGRGTQWNAAISRDAFANSGVSPSVVPKDSASYVGASKAFAPGVRFDLYYVAIAGSTDDEGDVVCVAPAAVSVSDIDGFKRSERVLATEVWGADTCGWGLDGWEQQTVYAWDDATRTLHAWQPDVEHPIDVVPPPGEDILKLCEAPTIVLSGQAYEHHPPQVCDLEALHGAGNYRLSDTPWEMEISTTGR